MAILSVDFTSKGPREERPASDIVERALARFGYAVAGLHEGDMIAVLEIFERVTDEMKKSSGTRSAGDARHS